MVVYTRNFSIHFEQLSFLYNLGWLPSTALFTSLQRHELSVAFKEQPLINTCEIPLCVCCKVRSCVCEKRSSHYFVAILSNELPACVNIRDLLLWQWLPSEVVFLLSESAKFQNYSCTQVPLLSVHNVPLTGQLVSSRQLSLCFARNAFTGPQFYKGLKKVRMMYVANCTHQHYIIYLLFLMI